MLIFSLVITSVPGLFVPTPAYAINEKLTTAIVSIESPTENDLPVRINTALSAAMVKSHRFEVTDSEQVASTLKDMQLAGKKLNITQACEVGKALGVNTVTMAQGYGIESDNEKCYITIAVQIIDVETGIVIQNAFARGEGFKGEKFELSDEAINNGCFASINMINDNMSKVGLIATIKDGQMRISIGGDIGVKDQSEFTVYRENKVIGKLKTVELDSYDTATEELILVPGYTLQEGDIVVVAYNQGEKIDRTDSPSTVKTASPSAGIILTAVLVGAALALIGTNQSDQIQKLAMVYHFQAQFIRHEGDLAVYLLTVQITDHNGNIVPDGTTVTFQRANEKSNEGVVVGFGNAIAYEENVQTFGGIASTILYTQTGGNLTVSPAIKIRSEGRDSQIFIISAANSELNSLSVSTDPNEQPMANGQDIATVTATITPPKGVTITGGQVLFQIISGSATFEGGSRQYLGPIGAGSSSGGAVEVKARLVSNTVGPSVVLVQYMDVQETATVVFGQVGVIANVSPEGKTLGPGQSEFYTVTVTDRDPKDKEAKPIAGANIQVSSSGSGAGNAIISPVSGATGSDGKFVFLITNNRAAAGTGETKTKEYLNVQVTAGAHGQTVTAGTFIITDRKSVV